MTEEQNLALECLKLAQEEGMTFDLIVQRAAQLERWVLEGPTRQRAVTETASKA